MGIKASNTAEVSTIFKYVTVHYKDKAMSGVDCV